MQFTKSGLQGCLALPHQVEVEERLGVWGWADQPDPGALLLGLSFPIREVVEIKRGDCKCPGLVPGM